MKKLFDETSDDLTRALLEAGRSHRPSLANRTKVLAALGAGAGVGLFSSQAFAWLGTSAGKLTLLGVSLGVAGAVLVARPSAEPARMEARAIAADVPQPVSDLAPASRVAPSAPLALKPVTVPAPVADAPFDPRPSPATGSRVTNAVSARRADAPAASERRRRAPSGELRRAAAGRDIVVSGSETNPDGPLPAASAPPPAVGAPEPQVALASGLESEIQLVDAMRGAAQRNDTAALRHLVASYRGSFPEGQLRQEVSELALRGLAPAQ